MLNMKFLNRKSLTPVQILLLTALFILVTGNATFGEKLLGIYSLKTDWLFLGSVWVVSYLVSLSLMALFALFLPLRLVAFLFLVIAAVCGFFAETYGVVIDTIMIQNTFETNLYETSNLLTTHYIGRILLLGVLPFLSLYLVKLKPVGYFHRLKSISLVLISALLLSLLFIFMSSGQFASFFREHKQVRFFINPVYPIYSLGRFIQKQFEYSGDMALASAQMTGALPSVDESRELVILVVGETARADHFALNGYDRDTNPLLSKEPNLVSFSDVSSCGTSTAISVPCIFALNSKDDFDVQEAQNSENLLDVIAASGVNVLWRDNNSDSKHVADRIQFEDFKSPKFNPVCDHGECRDIGLLAGLQDYIDEKDGDILIILHQMGSHGPAYYLRYPPAFEYFKPSCNTLELSDCSNEEIINAYDNTIRYTDYFLSQVIALLKNNRGSFEPALFYVSDHGESLGEQGIYLHGLPYMIAPKAQTHVAMLVWGDDHSDIDIEKTRRHKDKTYSHDSIASTLIQLFEIELELERDISMKNSDESLIFLKEDVEDK